MIISYKVKTTQPHPALAIFEETLSFADGFRHVQLPSSLGEGNMSALHFAEDFHVNFQFYRLNVPLEVIKQHSGDPRSMVYIVFYQLEHPETADIDGEELKYEQEGVNIYTQAIQVTLRFPAETHRNAVCMRISKARLASLLGNIDQEYLNQLLHPDNSFFIHERLTTGMRNLVAELRLPPSSRNLQQLYYHSRVMQLIYMIMEQLNKRALVPAKNHDPALIAKVLKARSILLEDLSTPPTIAQIARQVLLSESQLKLSFREIFGDSVYQYFQRMRLEKARQLLTENNHTVRDVALELGFTNIGHFSRLFERAFYIKPKKYQLSTRSDSFFNDMGNLYSEMSENFIPENKSWRQALENGSSPSR